MTDDETDDTPRTHSNGEQSLPAPYRSPDPAQRDLYKRIDRLERDAADQRLESALLAANRRTWRWVVPTLLTVMLALTGYAVGQISSSAERAGETRTEIKSLGKLIDLLSAEISELRRHAGLDPRGTVAIGAP